MSGGEPPEDIPVKEFFLLHDPEAAQSLAILFFENDEDDRKGDETAERDAEGRHTRAARVGRPLRRRASGHGLRSVSGGRRAEPREPCPRLVPMRRCALRGDCCLWATIVTAGVAEHSGALVARRDECREQGPNCSPARSRSALPTGRRTCQGFVVVVRACSARSGPRETRSRSGWSLDGDPGIRPEFHAFVASRAPGDDLPDDGLPRYDDAIRA